MVSRQKSASLRARLTKRKREQIHENGIGPIKQRRPQCCAACRARCAHKYRAVHLRLHIIVSRVALSSSRHIDRRKKRLSHRMRINSIRVLCIRAMCITHWPPRTLCCAYDDDDDDAPVSRRLTYNNNNYKHFFKKGQVRAPFSVCAVFANIMSSLGLVVARG